MIVQCDGSGMVMNVHWSDMHQSTRESFLTVARVVGISYGPCRAHSPPFPAMPVCATQRDADSTKFRLQTYSLL